MSSSPVKNKKILITAGPTREWMDPVRYLSNPSSGAMGISLAETLAKQGAKVTLVLGPATLKPSRKIKTIHVTTALEMFSQVKKHARRIDAFIASAAVGDWRFAKISPRKLKKASANTMTIKLVKNPDIAGRVNGKFLKIGFALETDTLEKNAIKKLHAKNLDLIVANKPNSFGNESIRPLLIEKSGKVHAFPSMKKENLSQKIATWLKEKWNEKH